MGNVDKGFTRLFNRLAEERNQEDDPRAVRCAACARQLAFEVASKGAIAAAVEERLDRDLAVARESQGTVTVRHTQINLSDFVVCGPVVG